MGWTAVGLPLLWAQAVAASPPTSTTANPSALAPLALRRWYASLTLSSPESVPSLFGLKVWLAGLGGAFVLAVAFQGPGRALGQLVDIAGHARVWSAASRRLRRAGRVLAAAVGLTVLSWTGSQALAYNSAEGRDDLLQLTRARHVVELAAEQGVLAALTPLRDVAGLGSNLPLLVLATVLLFRASAEDRDRLDFGAEVARKRGPGWAVAGWVSGALMALYRLASIGTGSTDLPLGGCMMVEVLVVPALMAVCDGLLLGWVLSELRLAGFDAAGGESLDPRDAADLMPASVVACLAALPARYLATAVLLASYAMPTSAANTAVGRYVRWQLGHGLAEVQGAAWLVAGLAGAVAWGSGGAGEALRGYARLLASQGSRVVASLAAAGLAAGALSAAAYLTLLSLPTAPWVLAAADSYAHYATLPVGLWALAALVELGERSLPEAGLAAAPAPAA